MALAGYLATQLLARLGSANRASEQTIGRLVTLSDAIEQFVASNGRLPCPADPTVDTTAATWGDEAVPSPKNGTCLSPNGTVPWRTIGARQEDAIDSWGWKISYRVFTGIPSVAGSLTQERGVSMVECDTFEPTVGSATPVPPTTVEGGLCLPNADPTLRTTRPVNFLANKGLTLTDTAPPAKSDVAFVLLSHGPTGRGAYAAGGKLNPFAPAAGGDEAKNANAAGPFTIKAFSPAGTDPSIPEHFDDLLVYRTIPDLVRRTQLAARNWPEAVAPGTTGLSLDQATVGAAVGSPVTPGSSVGSVTVTFTGVVASGASSGGTPTEISFDAIGGNGGLGVAGGGSALLQSSANESLTFQFSTTNNTKFAVTLNDFGTYSGTFIELVAFQFYLGASNVATKFGVGCRIDGGLASFLIDVGTDFDRVVVAPLPAYDTSTATFSGVTATLVTEIAACPSGGTACVTSLTDFGNLCTAF